MNFEVKNWLLKLLMFCLYLYCKFSVGTSVCADTGSKIIAVLLKSQL